MLDITLKDYIDKGYVLKFNVDNVGKYNGLLRKEKDLIYLVENNLKELKKYVNIHSLLRNSSSFIKITGNTDYYVLQLEEKCYEGPYNESFYFSTRDMEVDSNIESLLSKYDTKKKEELV